jgi:hypothetical protein
VKHSTLDLHNGTRLFLIEDFFPVSLAAAALELFKTGPSDSTAWEVISDQTHAVDRFHYIGSSTTLEQLQAHAKSKSTLDYFSTLINCNIEFVGVALWLDQAGYSIPPHYDLDPYHYAAQIYITDTPNAMSGTTIYNELYRPIAQLPLSHNFGYLIDKTTTILHGIATPIPESCTRCSVYMKYRAI